MSASPAFADPELPGRLLVVLGQTPGIASAAISGPEGSPASESATPAARQDAAIAAFISARAGSLTGDGDLRGMGRQLIGSHLLRATLAGPGGEYLVMPYAGGSVFIAAARGATCDRIAPNVTNTLQRYC
jgi:hypothetical protein